MRSAGKTKWLWTGLSILVCWGVARPAEACGPPSTEAEFHHALRPGSEMPAFARGRLELVLPTFARSYLVVAWCHLSGRGLTAEEQKGAVDYWNERLGAFDNTKPAIDAWYGARALVPGAGAKPAIEPFKASDDYVYTLNCAPDAFFTAAATLRARVGALGADSPEVREWLTAQDQVFAGCAGTASIPAEARPDASPQAKADRAYQLAAAHFYAGHHDEAVRRFQAITQSDSPWREVAPYLVTRAMVRRAYAMQEEKKEPAAVEAAWKEAQATLQKLVADPAQARFQLAALRLLSETELALEAEPSDESAQKREARRLARLVLQLAGRQSAYDMKHLLLDLSWRMDALLGNWEEVPYEKQDPTVRSNELTDWIATFQEHSIEARDHAVKRWQETRAVPWLVAALQAVDGRHPQAGALLEAAGQLPADSPASLTVTYHRARLLIESGRKEEARALLDPLLEPKEGGLSRSSRNQLLDLRLRLARNLDEMLRDGQQVPAAIKLHGDYPETVYDPADKETDVSYYLPGHIEGVRARYGKALWSGAAADLLNERTPLEMLARAAGSKELESYLRDELALATFVRAALLDRHDIARQLAVPLRQHLPALKGLLNAYLAEKSLEGRRFAAAHLILKHPGARPFINAGLGRLTPLDRIDAYRDNWWWLCGSWPYQEEMHFYQGRAHQQSLAWKAEGMEVSEEELIPPTEPPIPAFLTPAELDAARQEWASLEALGEGANVLTRFVLTRADQSRTDPRLPEALHLAVRATRYSCGDDKTSSHSRQAFQVLHRHWPGSRWAKKTPYWF